MSNQPLVMERIFKAPIELVWKALTNKHEMKKWYFDIPDFSLEVGKEFSFSAGCSDHQAYLHCCRIVEVVENRRISYTWRYDGYEGESVVTFELEQLGDETKLILTHTGLETFPASNPDFNKNNFNQGWTHFMDTALRDYLKVNML